MDNEGELKMNYYTVSWKDKCRTQLRSSYFSQLKSSVEVYNRTLLNFLIFSKDAQIKKLRYCECVSCLLK